ncbi:sulfite exporter TauE/SafE family protein [Chakrabartia godavariana]|nr:sulfite exporter TauE/SafE family protein [Chakrabartia godavariana]
MTLPHDPVFYIVASLAIILVGVAKGGFAGLGAASMPILVLVMDPVPAAAMLLPILIVQDVVGVWAFRQSFDLPTLKLMVPGALVGVFLGWLLATVVPADAVRALVGLISVAFGSYRLAGDRGLRLPVRGTLPNWVGTFWGGVSGFTSQVAHAGGPPFQIWALTRNLPHTVFIGTSAIFFAILNWMKVPAYFALGQFTWANLQLTLVFLPVAIASTFAGVWLVKRVSAARFNTVISLLMVAVGIELLRVALT